MSVVSGSAPGPSPFLRGNKSATVLSVIAVIVVAAIVVGAILLSPNKQTPPSPTTTTSAITQSAAYSATNTTSPTPGLNMPVSQSILQQLTGVSDSTLSAVGPGSTFANLNPVSGTPLTSGGKPEVLYVGGEFCPYCAIERWSMIIALSRFGSFSGLEYMQSSSTDVNANTPTYTFRNMTYSSQYVSFVPVEEYNRSDYLVQPLTAEQGSLVAKYDTGGGIPFLDIGNSYAVVGAQFSLELSGQSWTAVASQLNNASSPIALGMDGAANTLITAICKIDGGQPSSVCGQTYATLPLAYVGGGTEAVSSNLASPRRLAFDL